MMGIPLISLAKVNVLSFWQKLRCLDFGPKRRLWLIMDVFKMVGTSSTTLLYNRALSENPQKSGD